MRYTLGKIEDIICASCLIVMTTLTFANVIARYVFSASFSFSEEITTSLFVLLSLIGSTALFRYGISMVQSQIFHGQVTAGMQWLEWIFVPLGAFFITVEFLFMLIDTDNIAANFSSATTSWKKRAFPNV